MNEVKPTNKQEELIEKIKKLLALSSSSNENEAMLAMQKAQELMVKYSINRGDIDASEVEDKKVVTEIVIANKGRIMWYESDLARIVSDNFRCVYFTRGIKGNRCRNLCFMGLETDVEICKWVFNYALNQMKKLGNNAVKTYTPNDFEIIYHMEPKPAKIRNDFYTGFTRGLKKAFKEQIEKNNWGLILVKDALVEKEEENLHIKIVRPSGIRPMFGGDNRIINKGFTEGYNTGKNYEQDKNTKINP